MRKKSPKSCRGETGKGSGSCCRNRKRRRKAIDGEGSAGRWRATEEQQRELISYAAPHQTFSGQKQVILHWGEQM